MNRNTRAGLYKLSTQTTPRPAAGLPAVAEWDVGCYLGTPRRARPDGTGPGTCARPARSSVLASWRAVHGAPDGTRIALTSHLLSPLPRHRTTPSSPKWSRGGAVAEPLWLCALRRTWQALVRYIYSMCRPKVACSSREPWMLSNVVRGCTGSPPGGPVRANSLSTACQLPVCCSAIGELSGMRPGERRRRRRRRRRRQPQAATGVPHSVLSLDSTRHGRHGGRGTRGSSFSRGPASLCAARPSMRRRPPPTPRPRV